jgi:hypothetical protein
MAGDGELNARKRQPGDIPVVDKLLAAGAVLHAQTKRHRSTVSFRWTWSPAFGRLHPPRTRGPFGPLWHFKDTHDEKKHPKG